MVYQTTKWLLFNQVTSNLNIKLNGQPFNQMISLVNQLTD